MNLHLDLGMNSYDILIRQGCLQEAPSHILPHLRGDQVAILTDSHVGPLYGEGLLAAFEARGVRAFLLTIPPGEASKSMEQAMAIYSRLGEEGFGRKDLLVALGGGVVGDLGGFVAATWLRGVDFYQIPTSLLAQVDSSVGGKVAIDLPGGKNLVGAFHQPKGVLIDPSTLKTLEEKYFIDGMGEVIKYGAIFDAAFFAALGKDIPTLAKVREGYAMEEILYRCCQLKKEVVEKDEREEGLRALLNFGHTLGHGIEKAEGYMGHSHGEAVAMGMCLITAASEALGWTLRGSAAALKRLCREAGLPSEFPTELLPQVIQAIARDKKRQGKTLGLVILDAIGKARVRRVALEEVPSILERGLAYEG